MPGRHSLPRQRSNTLKLAAGLGVGVLVVGSALLGASTSAQAATTINETGIKLFAQVNNNAISGVQNLQATGTRVLPNPAPPGPNANGHNLSIVVSPSTALNTNGAFNVSISSSTLTICNGPVATADPNSSELQAVVVINSVQYVLRGPQNTGTVPASVFNNNDHAACAHSLFNTGWVVSSAPGGSSATSDTTNTAATTGAGAATYAAPASPVTLTAPAVAGSYNIGLKALVVNSGTLTSFVDQFDQFINLDNGGHTADAVNELPASSCDNSSTCPGYAGPGGITGNPSGWSPAGVGTFLSDDPQMYISAASPTTSVPASPPTTKNNPTARNLAIPASTAWNPVTLAVTAAAPTSSSPPASATPTATVTQTVTATATVTATSTATATATVTAPAPTVTATVTTTPTATVTATPTVTVTAQPTVTPTVTQTATVTAQPTATPTVTQTVTQTATVTATPTVTETVTASPTATPTVTETVTAQPSITPTVTTTATVTADPTVTPTVTTTATATETATATATETETATSVETETVSSGSGSGSGNADTSVSGTSSGTGTLAATGSDTRRTVLLALVLLQVGAVLVVRGYRRPGGMHR